MRGIFPDDEDGELVRGKMKDLVDYGRTVPDKLEEIVFKIRRKALSYLKSGRPGCVACLCIAMGNVGVALSWSGLEDSRSCEILLANRALHLNTKCLFPLSPPRGGG